MAAPFLLLFLLQSLSPSLSHLPPYPAQVPPETLLLNHLYDRHTHTEELHGTRHGAGGTKLKWMSSHRPSLSFSSPATAARSPVHRPRTPSPLPGLRTPGLSAHTLSSASFSARAAFPQGPSPSPPRSSLVRSTPCHKLPRLFPNLLPRREQPCALVSIWDRLSKTRHSQAWTAIQVPGAPLSTCASPAPVPPTSPRYSPHGGLRGRERPATGIPLPKLKMVLGRKQQGRVCNFKTLCSGYKVGGARRGCGGFRSLFQ